MTIDNLKDILTKKGATEILFKKLSDNDNAKQQVYLGGSYDVLQFIPYGTIYSEQGTKRATFKAPLKMFWIDDYGTVEQAPNAKLILYPKYPEIRLSGFLSDCSISPGPYMRPKTQEERTGGQDGRILLICPIGDELYAYLAPPGSPVSMELMNVPVDGVFGRITLESESDSRKRLLEVLKESYRSNPNQLVRMWPDGIVRPYTSRNAAGYTLEAKFGIIPNGLPEPDFKGWELKCFLGNAVTLMTPQPDGGLYEELGNREFVNRFGHLTEDGDMYFTGPYSVTVNDRFGSPRRFVIEGFSNGKIVDSNGAICLLENDLVLASWSFAHILSHWNRKHNKVCYVRYKKHVDAYSSQTTRIDFLPNVFLCEGTSAIRLIEAISSDVIYHDPACKVTNEGISKARHQFRTVMNNLNRLYDKTETYDLSV